MAKVTTKIVVRFPFWAAPPLTALKVVARGGGALGWKPSEKAIDRVGTFIGELIVKHARFTCE